MYGFGQSISEGGNFKHLHTRAPPESAEDIVDELLTVQLKDGACLACTYCCILAKFSHSRAVIVMGVLMRLHHPSML